MDKADLLLVNANVLTMDSEYRLFPGGAVAVRDGAILAAGDESDLRREYRAEDEFDCRGSALLPALVNAHTHAAMCLLRGLADDRRLDVWLLGYMMPVERQFVSPDFVRLGTRLACAEMIRGGVGTFADMYYFEDEIAAAAAEAGMRALCAQTVMKYPTPDSASYEDGLERARAFLARWKDHALIHPAVAAHAPYTCTEEILRACASLAVEFDRPLHIHLAETAQEVEQARQRFGMPEVPYLRNLGLFSAKIIAAHCVHLDEGEMRTLWKAGAGIVHAPTSNLKLGSGIAPVAKMLEIGLTVGIGTDGAASNNDLDMFEEMRLAALLAKGVSGDPTALPARTALAMATRMGAEALHIGSRTGSLEPGKRADLLLLDLGGIHSSPGFERDPESVYSRIVYSAKAGDVTGLMVDGRWLLRNRRLQTLPEADLLHQAAEMARRLDSFLALRESSVLSKLVAIETASEEESFEVQVKVIVPEGFPLPRQLAHPDLEILYSRHYREYDTYFEFPAADQGRLRYREDQAVGEGGETMNARYRLTLTGPTREREFTGAVLLSRSRFLAGATHSLRFYREYFQPAREIEVNKQRLRWQIRYRGKEFFVNFDSLSKPALPGRFLEVKARTWSRRDSENKAGMIVEIVRLLGAQDAEAFRQDYVEMAGKK
ncbi:MAG: amidohydrolase [Anaerolineales bacterium]|nr:amidohydrolase [Anaerolineales bacterium]